LYVSDGDAERARLVVAVDGSRFVARDAPQLTTYEFVRGYGGDISGLIVREGREFAEEAAKVPAAAPCN
jgi:hypothetical protein